MPQSKHNILVFLLFALLAALVFAPGVRHPFLNWDDRAFVSENPYLEPSWRNVCFLAADPSSELYTPLTFYSLMLDRAVFGGNPAGYHIVNIALHWGAACLLYLIFLRLGMRRDLACMFGLIWMLSTQKVESVAWIFERKDVLCGILAFGSFYCFQRMYDAGRRRWSVSGLNMAAGILAVLAIFAKPAAAALPGVFLVYAYCQGETTVLSPDSKFKTKYGTAAWMAALRGAVCRFADQLFNRMKASSPRKWRLAAWPAVAAFAADAWSAWMMTKSVPGELEMNLAVPLHNLFWYPLKALFPTGMNPIYPGVNGYAPYWMMYAAGIFLAGLLLYGAVRMRFDRVNVLCMILTAGGMLVPVLGLIRYTGYDYCDRYNYLASAPVLAGVGLMMSALWNRPGFSRKRIRTQLILFALYLAMLALYSLQYQQIWKDERRLFLYALRHSDGRPNPKTVDLLLGWTTTEKNTADVEPVMREILAVLESNREYYDASFASISARVGGVRADGPSSTVSVLSLFLRAHMAMPEDKAEELYAEFDRMIAANASGVIFRREWMRLYWRDHEILANRRGDIPAAAAARKELDALIPENPPHP